MWPWSKIAELEERILDLERHMVVARDPKTGAITQTLADVPLKKRDKLKNKNSLHLGGLTWQQRQRVLEKTDGGRIMPERRTE